MAEKLFAAPCECPLGERAGRGYCDDWSPGTNAVGVEGMPQESPDYRLSLIATPWSLLFRATPGPANESRAPRQQLIDRYGGAVRRYLRKVLHDADAADEV